MKLATQDKPFFPERMEEKLRYIKELGFDAFEIDGALLSDRLDEVKAAVRSTGVAVSGVCGGYKGWIGDFDENKRRQCIADIRRILECASEIGAKGIVVPAAWGMFSLRLPPMVPPRSTAEDKAALLDSLGRLDRVAESTGTLVYLEPLNRYEDHMVNTIETARDIINEGGFIKIKITADFFHMNIEEKSIAQSIFNNKELIGHIHLADSHRYQPGEGHMDFISGFKALTQIGYEGYMTFECRVLGENPAQEYRKSVDYIKECIVKAR